VDEIEEDTQVAKKGRTEEQILRALRQAESGTRVANICREHGNQRSHVLHLEEEVFRAGVERAARAPAAARGELEA
jgi:hypothetical protein